MSKNQINIGIIGQTDHGKNTLKSTLTKFLSLKKVPQTSYYIINCVKNPNNAIETIELMSKIDIAVLVVSALTGPLSQTREHVLLARQLGISNLVVFINKIDQVNKEKVNEVEHEVQDLLSDYYFSDVKIIKGSALTAINSKSQNYKNDEYMCINKLLCAINALKTNNRSTN